MSRIKEKITVLLDLELVHETEKALLLSEGEGDNKHWVPKSQIRNLEELGEPEERTNIEIELPEWIAKSNGWI